MTFYNPRIINELGGITVDYIDQEGSAYFDPGTYENAAALDGAFGVVAPYEPPPAPEPIDPLARELPRREFRRALLHNGMDTATVLSVIGNIADPSEREEMTIWWEDTLFFQRNHETLVQMVAAAGLAPEQGDAIWVYGIGLVDGVPT